MFENLSRDIYFAQIYGMSKNTDTKIIISDDKYLLYSENKIIRQYLFNRKFKVSSNFANHEINFNDKGHIQKAGTVTFCESDKCQKIIFNLGSGRF